MTAGLEARRTTVACVGNWPAAERSRLSCATSVGLAAKKITAASVISGLVRPSIRLLCAIAMGLEARRIIVPKKNNLSGISINEKFIVCKFRHFNHSLFYSYFIYV
jgi:hypothetical protein